MHLNITNFFLATKSDGFRYRVREYDTNRDPRGPLSASAEVLYGFMTDLITGIARAPSQLVSIFPGSHPGTVQQDFRGREWAMSHFAETLSNQERRKDSQTATDTSAPSGELYSPGPDEYVREHPEIIQSSNAVTNETVANLSESHAVDGAGFTRRQTAMKKGKEKSYGKKRRRARRVLSETRYQAGKSAKHALNFVLVLPTDFTLSLSKGFHNAPKLYHDDTVKPMPKVIGIKSGFRAAGKVSSHMNFISRTDFLILHRSFTKGSIMACLDLSHCPPGGFGNREVKGWSRVSEKGWGASFSSRLQVRYCLTTLNIH